MNRKKLTWTLLAAVLFTTGGLSGCGGGSGGISSGTTGMLEGSAVKGPVESATVAAFGIENGTMGAQLGSATTDTNGHFSMGLGDYSGPVLLQMRGGTYTDEATGQAMAMADGDVMTAVIPAVSPNDVIGDIEITPLTSMAQNMAQNMEGGMTAANIAAANAAVSDTFLVNDILTTSPMNPLVSGSGADASQDSRNYGMVLAAMSQYGQDMGMASSSGVVTAMMNDAADGVMNGRMGGSQIMMGGMGYGMMGDGGNTAMQPDAGTSGLADAMTAFMATTRNRSGLTLTEMQMLRDRLHLSDGQLSTDGDSPTDNGTISGTAFNGTVQNATVAAYAVTAGNMGGQLASGTTDQEGNFSLSLGTHTGPVMLRLSGGTFNDLATGTAMGMPSGATMTALVPSFARGAAIDGIEITPLTSMAQIQARNMNGGMTAANIDAAATSIGAYFMVDDILTTPPMDPLMQGAAADSTRNQWNYGMTIAAMSQYAWNIGMTNSAWMIAAMANDASDGVLDGMTGNTSINLGGMNDGTMNGGSTAMQATAGTKGLAAAMLDFMGTASNMSGLTEADMQALMAQLQTSDGAMQ